MSASDLKRALPETIEIVLADVEDLKPLAELMDLYRVWYGQPSTLPAAEHFLFERMINHESVIYLARDTQKGRAAGFLQLYPTFSSVSLAPVWTLNDLYVHADFRGQGIATALINEAKKLVRDREDKGLQLSTAHDNLNAQRLYEALGFKRDTHFQYYEWLRDQE